MNDAAAKKYFTGLRRLFNKHETILFIAMLVLIFVFSIFSETFFTKSNFLTILNQSSMVFIIAVGMTIVIILGGIDLSAGYVAGLSGIVVAIMLSSGVPVFAAVLIGLILGAAAGFFNGIIITKIGITDFIVTLASMSIAHGLIYSICGGNSIYKGIPKSFMILGQGKVFFNIPIPVLLAVMVFFVGHTILSKTALGTYFYAVGGNKDSSRLSGIKIDTVRITGYIICGITASFAGIIMTSRLGSGQPTAGDSFLFDAIGATVIGGTNMSGGEGTIYGTAIGVAIIGIISNGLTQLGVSFFSQEVIKGFILIFAVTYNYFRVKRANG